MSKEYRVSIYLSRNTNKEYCRTFPTVSEARKYIKVHGDVWMFPTEDFHGNPIKKAKLAILSGSYPNEKFEMWEKVEGHDSNFIKTEWN